MGLNDISSSERIHIGFFGLRNAGKSSLVNAVTGQELALVSDVKGTTTDPVKKAMELLPLGPVVIIDTPGIDDEGTLGGLRVKKARQTLNYTDIAVLTVDASKGLQNADRELITLFEDKKIPYLIAYNKADLLTDDTPDIHTTSSDAIKTAASPEHVICVSAETKQNIYELKKKIANLAKKEENNYLFSVNSASINRGLQILDIQERERQRIARDLHDTSLQNLTHIIHKIEFSSMFIDEDPTKAKLELSSVNKNLRSVIKEIRNTIFDLRPMTFDDLGLKESFERLADHLRESSGFEVFYNIEEINCNNSLVLMTIFRIIEECTNNAIKHSNGSVVFFELKKITENTCIIIVADNGKSFDAEKVLSEKQRHFGLNILRERVELLCGTIEIDSKPDKGTVIKIIIPLLEK